MTGSKKHDSATKSLQKLKLLKLDQRRATHESVFIHKIMLTKMPTNLHEQYKHYSIKSNTRAASLGKMKIPKHRTSKFKKSPLYRTIKSWNKSLPFSDFGNIKIHKDTFQQSLLNDI